MLNLGDTVFFETSKGIVAGALAPLSTESSAYPYMWEVVLASEAQDVLARLYNNINKVVTYRGEGNAWAHIDLLDSDNAPEYKLIQVGEVNPMAVIGVQGCFGTESMEELLDKYSEVELTFNTYYEYMFTFTAILDKGKSVLIAEVGCGSGEDIYKFDIAAGEKIKLKNLGADNVYMWRMEKGG